MCASRCCSNFYFLNAVCWKSSGFWIWWTGLEGIQFVHVKTFLSIASTCFQSCPWLRKCFGLLMSVFLYYKQNLLIRHSKPAAGWGVIKSIMQELVEILLCINVVAKEMEEVSCSRMTQCKVVQSECYRNSRAWFCPVVSHANVMCATPQYPPPIPPQAVNGFFSAGNTIGFFLFALFHTGVWSRVY